MSKFWELYERNAVISGALAIILVLGVVVISIQGQEVPQVLAGFAGAACGYYFGAGKVADVARAVKRA